MTTTTAPAALTYAWNDPRPYIGRCPRCSSTVALCRTLDEQNEQSSQTRCHECNAWTIVTQVDGRLGKRECGDWCTEGTGRKCTCTCGGASHGLAYRVRS